MKKFLTTIMCIMLMLAFTACGGNERTETEPGNISLGLSTAENDIEYMQASDLSAFGLEKAENCTLTLDFTDSESTEEGFIVSGAGTLDLNGKEYDFNIADQELLCIEVSGENTVYSGILDSAISMETGEEQEISIDFTANRDFSQAVATVSADGGYLFFGDVFDDYLEYFNMILSQMAQDGQE
ncbi:MAG: hypothetical protein MR908_09450 [Firmicutes bacterium]|nr:hypothetical protein [Bacillota bacterium]